MRAARLLAISTSVMLSSSGRADPIPGGDVTTMATDDCARARLAGKLCVLEIPAEEVAGQLPGSTDAVIRLVWVDSARSLMRLRRDFIPEILKTAEDL
jgi:hypothetical protein